MKHLRKFEEMDYRELLAQQAKLKSELDRAKQEEIEKVRQDLAGKRLSQLADESEKQRKKESLYKERQELTHLVVQSLIYSEMGKSGFENFKNELQVLLEKFPLDTLPKSGVSIYRD
jgi:hypothetical protein